MLIRLGSELTQVRCIVKCINPTRASIRVLQGAQLAVADNKQYHAGALSEPRIINCLSPLKPVAGHSDAAEHCTLGVPAGSSPKLAHQALARSGPCSLPDQRTGSLNDDKQLPADAMPCEVLHTASAGHAD